MKEEENPFMKKKITAKEEETTLYCEEEENRSMYLKKTAKEKIKKEKEKWITCCIYRDSPHAGLITPLITLWEAWHHAVRVPSHASRNPLIPNSHERSCKKADYKIIM